VWVVNSGDRTVSRIDPSTRAVSRTIPVEGNAIAVAADSSGAWVASAFTRPNRTQLTVSQIDTQFYDVSVKDTIDVGVGPVPRLPAAVALRGRAVWSAFGGTLGRFVPPAARADAQLDVAVIALATSAEGVWVAGGAPEARTLELINPQTMGPAGPRAAIGDGAPIAAGAGAVWVTSSAADTVTRFDPHTLTALATIPLPPGSFPVDVAYGEDAVWVANRLAATVSRIDPEQNKVVATIRVGGDPEGIAAGEDAVWVTVQ
jgi:YVTN family beta-propeller protein